MNAGPGTGRSANARPVDERPAAEGRPSPRPLRVEIGHLVVRGPLPEGGPEALAELLAAALGRCLPDDPGGDLAARAAAAVVRAVTDAGVAGGGGDGRA